VAGSFELVNEPLGSVKCIWQTEEVLASQGGIWFMEIATRNVFAVLRWNAVTNSHSKLHV
jgi:hypothetical protein